MQDPDVLMSFGRVQVEEENAIAQAKLREGHLLMNNDRMGIALSGGGIRSATFCLGVLQALAKQRLLSRFDYLSTVSGGGYVGSWLSAWTLRRTSFAKVEDALRGSGINGAVEAPEVTWLRRHSNYLAPKLGLLSADSMTLVATWLRNVLLNLVIFATFMTALFLLPRLLLVPATYAYTDMPTEFGYAAAWLGFFILPLGIAMHFSRYFMQDDSRDLMLMNSAWGVMFLVIIPGGLAAVFGSLSVFRGVRLSGSDVIGVAAVAAGLLFACGAIVYVLQRIAPRRFGSNLDGFSMCVFMLAYSMAILAGAILVIYFNRLIGPLTAYRIERTVSILTFGPPALLVTFGVMGSVIVGLVGRVYLERSREWWSRMNAWFIILGLAWLLLVGLSFYAAPLLAWAFASMPDWAAAVAGAGWLGSLAATLFAKGPASTERTSAKLMAAGLNLALVVVVAGLLIGLAGGVGFALEAWGAPSVPKAATGDKPSVELRVQSLPGREGAVTLLAAKDQKPEFRTYIEASFAQQDRVQRSCIHLDQGGVLRIGHRKNLLDCTGLWSMDPVNLAFLACIVLGLIFGGRVDVNKFSLHNMYKNRLVRCYLGASRQDDRQAHPFTGFDEADDLALSDLAHDPVRGPVRPFHIVNAALNITQGRHLAWQERKAASFTFSPLHCGFMLGKATGDARGAELMSSSDVKVGGYRRTSSWASEREERGQFSLGMALATSGAAFSPIRGQGSTPATAFLATLFNIRLGRWSPNPLSRSTWRVASPAFGLYYLFKELFGYATETSRFVYLSDGGHFDNTGVYELVRRRCTTILVVDATADLARGFDDLGNLVRKCRVDLGVNIEFDFEQLGTEHEPMTPSKGYGLGTIRYPGGPDGKLIIIKPTLIRRKVLGIDIFSYSRGRRAFPHQTTVDQFFSESQFESYRALGERIGTACLKDKRVRL